MSPQGQLPLEVPPTVYLVDDDDELRDGLTLLLERAGYRVCPFGSAEGLLAALDPRARGCIVLDVNLPGLQGPELQAELGRRGTRLPILFLTGSATVPLAVEAIRAGARDVLLKPAKPEVLLARVAELVAEHTAFARVHDGHQRLVDCLTPREREVLALLAEGLVHKDIAARLGISFRTVEVHRAHIMRKTGLATTLALADFVRAARAAKVVI
ncbi:MAG: response regulator [Archangium sp.]|nr:response regulator [Archangium sp.]